MIIKEVRARIIKNSRGEDAIEVTVNKKYTTSAPAGASTGTHEVVAFPVKGIRFSVAFLNKYPNFSGLRLEEFADLGVFDVLIPVIGGNAVIALQLACLKAMSGNSIYSFLHPKAKKLPIPLGNCVGGGAHTKRFSTDIQEFLLVPSAKMFRERMLLNQFAYDLIGKLTGATNKTDEGAFVLKKSDEEVLDFLQDILFHIEDTGLGLRMGVDVAASQFYKNRFYHYKNFSSLQKKKMFSPKEQIVLVNRWIKKYDLAYVEDGLHEEDFEGFARLNKRTLVCGDDLLTTNMERLKIAVRKCSVNSMIVKPNQIGSLVQTKAVVDFAGKHDIATVISHRSGETMDTSIAHLAVAWNIPYIKTGIHGKERVAKLQELVRIEDEISS